MHAAYLLSRAEQCGHLTAQQTNDVRAKYLALGMDVDSPSAIVEQGRRRGGERTSRAVAAAAGAVVPEATVAL